MAPPARAGRRRRPPGVLLAAALLAGLAAPALSCDRIDAFEAHARTGAAPEGALCSQVLVLGGRSGTACRWRFGFRAPEARDLAESLWSELTSCRAGRAAAPDARVNHPDSYELREWASGGRIFRVSLKDKSALGFSYVFLRLD